MWKCLTASALLLACLSGCRPPARESAAKFEKATVIQMAYVPRSSGSTSATGFTTNGDLTFSSGSVTTPEVWAVVFKCKEHGATFSLTGKDIYSKFHPGQVVTLEYVDIIETIDGKEYVTDHQTKVVHISQPK